MIQRIALASPSLVARLAQTKLAASPYLSLRRLTCAEQGGVLTLRGDVCSFYLKQMAQADVAGIQGVDEIDNQVRVVGAERPHPLRDRSAL